MSNRRRLSGARSAKVHCGSCGRAAGPGSVQLRDGRQICPRCVDRGVLAQRLPCGHMGVPGTMVIADSADGGNFQCVQCSPHASRPGSRSTA